MVIIDQLLEPLDPCLQESLPLENVVESINVPMFTFSQDFFDTLHEV